MDTGLEGAEILVTRHENSAEGFRARQEAVIGECKGNN